MPDSSAHDPAAAATPGRRTGSTDTYQPAIWKLLLGIFVVFWGTSVVTHSLFGVHGSAGNYYAMGQRFAGLAGLVLVAIGVRQIWFEIRARR